MVRAGEPGEHLMKEVVRVQGMGCGLSVGWFTCEMHAGR